MATLSQPAGDDRVSIGTILGRAFGVIGNRPLATLGVAFLLGALPSQLITMALMSAIDRGQAFSAGWIMTSLGSYVIALIASVVVQAAMMHTTLAYARGEPSSIGTSLAVGLRRFLPLLGLSILFGLGIAFGFMLLIVPGIILLVMWSVAAPALVVENVGVLEAFGRSRVLTKGHRWKIFGLEFLLLILLYLLMGVSGVILVMAMGPEGFAAGGRLSMAFTLYSVIVSTVVTAVWCTVQASLYVSLRNAKEGPQLESLADVFA